MNSDQLYLFFICIFLNYFITKFGLYTKILIYGVVSHYQIRLDKKKYLNFSAMISQKEVPPNHYPWNLRRNGTKSWTLTKGDDVFTFTKSKIDNNYVYVQKNDGKKIPYDEYKARSTYKRLFDSGYELNLLRDVA